MKCKLTVTKKKHKTYGAWSPRVVPDVVGVGADSAFVVGGANAFVGRGVALACVCTGAAGGSGTGLAIGGDELGAS